MSRLPQPHRPPRSIVTRRRCGSCWAVAATGALESAYLISTGRTASSQPVDFSEQQLVSCAGPAMGYYSGGCDGGYSDEALNFVLSYNQTTESKYPYTSGSTGATGACSSSILASTTDGQMVRSGGAVGYVYGSAAALRAAVDRQPVVVYINAQNRSVPPHVCVPVGAHVFSMAWAGASSSSLLVLAASSRGELPALSPRVRSFFSYAGGIYQATDCVATTINHAVVRLCCVASHKKRSARARSADGGRICVCAACINGTGHLYRVAWAQVVVGYHHTGNPSTDYFIIRNSWSSGWGESGYMKIAMTTTSNGPCGEAPALRRAPRRSTLRIPAAAPQRVRTRRCVPQGSTYLAPTPR